VLNKENADHWIGIASKHPRTEINELVKKHLMASGKATAGGMTATHVKTFKFHDDQVKTIDAAIERAFAANPSESLLSGRILARLILSRPISEGRVSSGGFHRQRTQA
jgi:hypothetical protein